LVPAQARRYPVHAIPPLTISWVTGEFKIGQSRGLKVSLFVGHFAIAFLLIFLFPQVPVWVPLVGVSFPDLLWGVLILLGKEEVSVSKDSPLQRSIVFKKYPYSHSFVLTGGISIIAGGLLSVVLGSLITLPVFVLASSSHWLLDTVVHLADLPVLGFDGDRKVGFGLWKWGRVAFLAELVLYVLFAVVFVKTSELLPVVAVGVLFHGINANSFLGLSRKNPFGSPRTYASVALVGFGVMSTILLLVL